LTRSADILIFGAGAFATRIACDIAAAAEKPVSVVLAGRNADRLGWLRTAANARAIVFGRPACFMSVQADLFRPEAASETIEACRPRLIVQAASTQTSAVIATAGNAWSRLVAEGGLSATALFQAYLTVRVARAVPPGCRFINCCFPDVVNSLLSALGLPIACGTGNVSILASAFAGASQMRDPGALQLLAHYQNLADWRQPVAQRHGRPPRVWEYGTEVGDVFARFASVRLTVAPAIEVSGAAGVPLMLAMVGGDAWRGHAPGPNGLPGGYPVAWDGAELALDLPSGITQAEAIGWNASFEAANGLVIRPDGRVEYTGALQAALRRASPVLARGFAVSELDDAYAAMSGLRDRLESSSA